MELNISDTATYKVLTEMVLFKYILNTIRVLTMWICEETAFQTEAKG